MPLKNAVDDVQKDKVSSLPLRRSKRLNTNPPTLPNELTNRASETSKMSSKTKENGNFSSAEELSQVEETKSSVINEVTANLDTEITKGQDRTLTSVCVQDSLLNDGTKLMMEQNSANLSNEIDDGFATKRITRSHGNSRAKIDTKECFVILEVTNALEAASFEQKIDSSNFDKANEADSDKQVDGQISSKEDFKECSVSKTSHEEQQSTVNKTTEEFLPISCNLNLNIKPIVNMPDGKDTMVFQAEDEFLGNSVGMKNDIQMKDPETTVYKNCVFENNEHKKQHEVTVNSEEIQSQIVGQLEFSESPSLANCSNEVCNITSETEASYLNELSDDVNGVDNRKSVSGNEVLNNADSSLDSSLEKSTLHQASIDENYIDSKIDHLLSSRINTSDEDENEPNPFINSMAEEGEEDTPSEGSNDIVEVGKEINTTDSEFSSDESYENNSFIDDKDDYQLLSGEEYDLSFDKTIKKSRIIKLSSGSDDDIVRISKPISKSRKIRKKSRIIKFSDSSDDEDAGCNENKENELCNSSFEKNPILCNDEPNQVTVIEKRTEVEDNLEITDISNNDNKENANVPYVLNNFEVTVTPCNNESTTMNMNQLLVNEYENRSKIVDVSDFQQSDSINYRKNEETFETIEHNKCNDMNELLTSLAIVNVNVNMRTENNSFTDYFKVKNIDSKRLSDRINEVVDSLCSNITNINEIIISLSVDYSNGTEGFKNEADESIQLKVAEDAIHKTKLSQDCSKKRGGRKRKICKKKILPENIREHEESNKPKTKKIKLENKRNENPFVNENSSTKHLSLKNKKFKHNHKEKMSAPSTEINKQLQEQNNYISKQKYVNNKRFTVIETGNEELSKEIRMPMPENINVKRKRRLKGNKGTVRNLAMTILDEALFDVKNKEPSSINQDVQICEEWDVNSVVVKPSSVSGLQNNKIEHSSINGNENENLDVQKKFTAKDFKNLMLYDSSRIKRISTKKALTKRGLNA